MKEHYVKLGISLSVSLVLMFVLTMSMIDTVEHFHLNLSNFYMAMIMVAPMGIVMLVVMWGMFKDRQLNYLLLGGFTVLFIASLWLGRSSALVGDEQFLRSMIPHHSRAILVCQESDITDPEILELCDAIIQAQREEIRQMEEILERY